MSNSLIGRTIIDVRTLTQDEKDQLDWWGHCEVYTLDDSTEMVASRDGEGNGPGVLWHLDAGELLA